MPHAFFYYRFFLPTPRVLPLFVALPMPFFAACRQVARLRAMPPPRYAARGAGARRCRAPRARSLFFFFFFRRCLLIRVMLQQRALAPRDV